MPRTRSRSPAGTRAGPAASYRDRSAPKPTEAPPCAGCAPRDAVHHWSPYHTCAKFRGSGWDLGSGYDTWLRNATLAASGFWRDAAKTAQDNDPQSEADDVSSRESSAGYSLGSPWSTSDPVAARPTVDVREDSVRRREEAVMKREEAVDSREEIVNEREVEATQREETVMEREASLVVREGAADDWDIAASKRQKSLDRWSVTLMRQKCAVQEQEYAAMHRDEVSQQREEVVEKREDAAILREEAVEEREEAASVREDAVKGREDAALY